MLFRASLKCSLFAQSGSSPAFSLWNREFLCCMITLSFAVSGRSVLMCFCLAVGRSTSLKINASLAPEHREPESWFGQQHFLHIQGLAVGRSYWAVFERWRRCLKDRISVRTGYIQGKIHAIILRIVLIHCP